MNLKPVPPTEEPSGRPARPKRRRRRLRTIAMLPTLLTLGNLYFGFLAMYYCGREMHDLGAGVIATDDISYNKQHQDGEGAGTYESQQPPCVLNSLA